MPRNQNEMNGITVLAKAKHSELFYNILKLAAGGGGGGELRGTSILLSQPIECCYGGPNWRDGFSCYPSFKKLFHLFLSQSLEDGRYHRIQSIYSLGLEKYYKPALLTNK